MRNRKIDGGPENITNGRRVIFGAALKAPGHGACAFDPVFSVAYIGVTEANSAQADAIMYTEWKCASWSSFCLLSSSASGIPPSNQQITNKYCAVEFIQTIFCRFYIFGILHSARNEYKGD